jgi:HSP20 family protein
MSLLYREPTRLFSTLFDSPTGYARQTAPAPRWIPAMDLGETAQDYVLRADLPGLAPQDVAIDVEDRVLTISGERKNDEPVQDTRFLRVERGSGAFQRKLTLPEGVDPEAVAATFENGVLEVRIPKPEARNPLRVEISAGAPATIQAE